MSADGGIAAAELPLATLLSQLLVAFTIEFDNEFEEHWRARFGGAAIDGQLTRPADGTVLRFPYRLVVADSARTHSEAWTPSISPAPWPSATRTLSSPSGTGACTPGPKQPGFGLPQRNSTRSQRGASRTRRAMAARRSRSGGMKPGWVAAATSAGVMAGAQAPGRGLVKISCPDFHHRHGLRMHRPLGGGVRHIRRADAFLLVAGLVWLCVLQPDQKHAGQRHADASPRLGAARLGTQCTTRQVPSELPHLKDDFGYPQI